MRAITTGELGQMRVAQEEMMPDTCTVLSSTQTTVPGGGRKVSWVAGTTYAWRVRPLGAPSQTRFAEALGTRAGWIGTLPWDAVVDEKNRLRGADGTDYEVIGLHDARGSWPTALKLVLAIARD